MDLRELGNKGEVEGPGGLELDEAEEGRGRERGRGRSREKESGTGNRGNFIICLCRRRWGNRE